MSLKKEPKVSIIMGVYNCQYVLDRCIKSILNQTYDNWELIICDDCSSDNTLKVAKMYSNQYKNIEVIKNDKNSGLAFSLNRCLENAKGQYIARMDADDICLPERLEIQSKFLDNNKQYQVVGSGMILFDENGDKGIREPIERPNKYNTIKSTPYAHPTIMMRKEAYDSLNGYTVAKRTRRGQDLDLWFRFYAKGFEGYNIKRPLLKYHESVSDYKKRDLKTSIGIMQTMYLGYKQLGFPMKTYIYILKPLVSAIIPNKLMYLYHKKVSKQNNVSL